MKTTERPTGLEHTWCSIYASLKRVRCTQYVFCLSSFGLYGAIQAGKRGHGRAGRVSRA